MAKTMPKSKQKSTERLRPLQRLSLFFFHRPRTTAIIWLIVAVFGAASYATLLKREGFPSINTPFSIANGTYLINDAAKVDEQVAKPLSNFLLEQDGVKSVQTQSFTNFYNAQISYEEDVNAKAKSKELTQKIAAAGLLPERSTLEIEPYEFGFTTRGDEIVVAFYDTSGAGDTQKMVAEAEKAAAFIEKQNLPLVESASIINPYEKAFNPITQQPELSQQSFDRFGKRQDSKNVFYPSVVIGIQADKGADNLELDAQVQTAVNKLNSQLGSDYKAEISASFAPQINDQIDELQKALLEGLLAVLIVGSIVIAVRASFLTVISMITVIAIVNGILYLIGYSLNTITLFSLILGLALIVDDTIIMVEALDTQRRRQKTADKAVSVATGKVSRAMIAATSTAALSFAPLLFVGGILGSFIRAIPVTIITALFISLVVALVFIPLFARFLLLGKKQMGEGNVHEVAAGVEAKIARFISTPMLWAKGSTKKLFGVGLVALVIGFSFIGAGGFLFSKVTFNIFPPSKDSNQLNATITFAPNTDVAQAEKIADEVDELIGQELEANFVRASYYGQATIQSAVLYIDLTGYDEREPRAPELVDQLNERFAGYTAAQVEAAQVDAGPPAGAFTVQIKSSTDRAAAEKLANDVASFMRNTKLERADGSTVKVEDVSVSNLSIFTRNDGEAYVAVKTTFADTDTSAIVLLAEQAIKDEFGKDKVASYGLPGDAISFSAGQEDENQDSFNTLALAFPIVLAVIYVLLALQFRSLLQPLLIFMAIPFSLFGITLGLYTTDNAFSFFAMLGFFALIGLSIKNTILLTDYANQARRAGMGTVDAAHEALAERFRPLIATSFTAVFSLIPLALGSPFWEGLAVVLICGLLSSTFLVVTVFPYYYLGAEFLRQRINRRTGLGWLVLTVGLVMILPAAAKLFAPLLAVAFVKLIKLGYKRQRNLS